MKSAHAIVTWHKGLGVQREAVPPRAQSDLGLRQRRLVSLRSAVGTGCDFWGTEACYWSLEKGDLGAEKELGGKALPWRQCRGCGHRSGRGQLGLAGEWGQRSSFLGRLSGLCGPRSAAKPDTSEGAWLCSKTTPRKAGGQWLLALELRREERPETTGLPR